MRASLSPVFGPPCACLPDVQIFSPSASRAALQPRAPHPNGEALIAGTFVEFIFRASAFDDAAVCLTLEQHGTPIGTAWLLPAHRATTHGAHTLPLVGPDGAVAGHVCVEHLQINPIAASLQGPDATSLATANGAAWDFDRRLMVGHRGMGSSHVAAGSDKTAAPVTENTLASFMQAFRKGADYVEFDVHVSRDRIPFVYHNFEAYVASHGAAATPVRVDLADYPLAQLQTMQLISRQQLSHLPINGSLEALLAGTATPPPTPNIDDERECPTLEKVLTDLPPTLGFDVEIKYPLLLKGGVAWENDTHIPREPNEYVDLILNTVMQHGGNRPLFFTCFDPDICLMLKLKQKKYPVAFLTCAGVPSHGEYEDLRCRSLQGALAFAAGQGMLGVAPDSSPIIEHPDHVVTAHSLGLALFTWGGKNNYAENVALQKKHNVDGIILDRIGLPH